MYLTFMGYHIYFWANENGEPVHVHIAKGSQQQMLQKFG